MRGKLTLLGKAYTWYSILKSKNGGSIFKTVFNILEGASVWAMQGVKIYEQQIYNYKKIDKIKRKNLFYIKDNVNFIDTINDSKSIYLLRDKSILLKRMSNNIGRNFIYTPDSDYVSLLSFINCVKKFVIKPNAQGGGRGIEVATVQGDNIVIRRNADEKRGRIDDFAKQWINEDVVLEEHISQHNVLNVIYPLSVNSIRIHTVNINSNVEIVLENMIRFGSNNGNIDFDNALSLLVDQQGRIGEYAIQILDDVSQTKIFTVHPDTGVRFKDYQIPCWEEAKKLVIDAAKIMPEVCYIGWDVAITDNGPVIIEGNGAPASYSGIQLNQLKFGEPTVKHDMSALLKLSTYRKSLTCKKIETINKKLFIKTDEKQWEQCSYVIVLGSYNCKYRVERACQLFSSKSVKYIVCGKNQSFYSGEGNAPLSESEFMQQYLLECGVPTENILVENNSINTLQNIGNALAILSANYNSGKVGIITGGFHMRRVHEIVKKCAVSKKIKDNIIYIPAYGDHTRPDNWHKSFKGTDIILNELKNSRI